MPSRSRCIPLRSPFEWRHRHPATSCCRNISHWVSCILGQKIHQTTKSFICHELNGRLSSESISAVNFVILAAQGSSVSTLTECCCPVRRMGCTFFFFFKSLLHLQFVVFTLMCTLQMLPQISGGKVGTVKATVQHIFVTVCTSHDFLQQNFL